MLDGCNVGKGVRLGTMLIRGYESTWLYLSSPVYNTFT
jgi:hypothetical protein